MWSGDVADLRARRKRGVTGGRGGTGAAFTSLCARFVRLAGAAGRAKQTRHTQRPPPTSHPSLFNCPNSVHNRLAARRPLPRSGIFGWMEPSPMLVPLIRRSLLGTGYSDGEIRRLRENGAWATVRRGSYLEANAIA